MSNQYAEWNRVGNNRIGNTAIIFDKHQSFFN